MLERNGLEKCKVKAISLSNANDIPADIVTKMPFRIEEKECDSKGRNWGVGECENVTFFDTKYLLIFG